MTEPLHLDMMTAAELVSAAEFRGRRSSGDTIPITS